MLVVVIYSKQRACKGGGFYESDKDCFVNLSGRVSFDAYKEQRHAPKDDQSGDDELGAMLSPAFTSVRPSIPIGFPERSISKCGAKVQQKNEPTKKVSSLWFKVEQNQPLERS